MEKEHLDSIITKALPEAHWIHDQYRFASEFKLIDISVEPGTFIRLSYQVSKPLSIKIVKVTVQLSMDDKIHTDLKIVWNGDLPINQEKDGFDEDFLIKILQHWKKL